MILSRARFMAEVEKRAAQATGVGATRQACIIEPVGKLRKVIDYAAQGSEASIWDAAARAYALMDFGDEANIYIHESEAWARIHAAERWHTVLLSA